MDYSYVGNRLKRKKKKRLIRLLLFVLFIIIILLVLFYKDLNQKVNSSLTTPIINHPFSGNTQDVKKQNSSLNQAIQNALEGTNGSYGIIVKNLKTEESFYSNEHKVYQPGSLYKLWIMAAVFKQIQAGALIKDQILSKDVATLNDKFNIDPDLAEQTEGTVTLSVHDALNQMITISHNYAALLLTEKIKLSSVALFLKDNGFKESTVGTDGSNPTSTPYDIALFLEKLYKGELANEQYTKEMIDLLKNQQLNDKLPKYLPNGVDIAHKTGEIDFATHDAGIVYTSSGDYIIVVLSDSNSPPGAMERIAQVSKAVYNYFTNN